MNINITRQSANHQYDEDGRAITTWDDKKCEWIIEPEFENCHINWYGKDNDFPRGISLREYETLYPDHKSNPEIDITWRYDNIEGLVSTFGDRRYWEENVKTYPYFVHKNWDYYSKKQYPSLNSIIKNPIFYKYCDFHKGADSIEVKYNDEVRILTKSDQGEFK